MIIATAGHIDHGKTKLVEAITGINSDRLLDEKVRGISIDLGFAHRDLGNGLILNFIDCLLYTSPSPRDRTRSRMPSSA